MSGGKRILLTLCLVSALALAPAAHAQVAQILQLATGVIRVLPKLLKSNNPNRNGQGNGQGSNQANAPGSERQYQMGNDNNDQNNNQQPSNNGRHHHSYQTANYNSNSTDVIQSMHGNLIGRRMPAGNAQSSAQPATAPTPEPPAPYVMMSNP